ncbi:hypothetical protein FGO68_gene10320 [Halteria grandinella]|uniref:Uncharacterized protein n=1 Tax=Halteria grandinella TaxID=5974 RepID=A0A8J8NPT2_HALGN|nr:hypothetical protein FGO68_gene10320 [Halteria grandinella]
MSMLLHFDKERDRDGGYSDKKGLFHENEEGQLLTEDGDFKDQALQNHLYDDILFEHSSQNSEKSLEEPQDLTQLTVLEPRISSKDTHPLEPFQTQSRPPCKVRSVKKKPKSLREMLQQALVTGDSRDFIKLQRLYKTITMPVNKAQQDL